MGIVVYRGALSGERLKEYSDIAESVLLENFGPARDVSVCRRHCSASFRWIETTHYVITVMTTTITQRY